MSNPYYTPTGNPVFLSRGASALIRAEFTLVQVALDKLPAFSGNESKFVRVNAAGTALEATSAITGATFDGVIGGVAPAAGTFTTCTVTTTLTSAGTANLVVVNVTGAANFSAATAFSGAASFSNSITMPTMNELDSSNNGASTAYTTNAVYVSAYGFVGVSSSALNLAAGTQTLIASTGKGWVGGNELRFFNSAGYFMDVILNSYNSTTGAMSITGAAAYVTGSGSFSSWQISPTHIPSDNMVTRSFFLA